MRLVVEGGAPGERQMALDEATLLLLNQGVVDEMIRFWNFSPTTLSIGRFLSVHDWVNMDLLQQKKIPLIRRFTGGGPALHDELGEITWSVAVRSHEMMAVYRRIGEAIVMALKQLGLTGEFVPINDVVVKDKKVVGMAGAQKGNAVLVHGTFMFATDLSLMSGKDLEPMLHNIIKTYIADQLSAAELFQMKAEEMKQLFRRIYNEVMKQIREKNYAEF
ncbi:MAG: hypothetical protein QXX23_07270 [Thermoplasmata archaeon]